MNAVVGDDDGLFMDSGNVGVIDVAFVDVKHFVLKLFPIQTTMTFDSFVLTCDVLVSVLCIDTNERKQNKIRKTHFI